MLVGQTLSVVKMNRDDLVTAKCLLCRAWEPIQCRDGHVVLITQRNVYFNNVLTALNFLNLNATPLKCPIDTRCLTCNSRIFENYSVQGVRSANFRVRGELITLEEQLSEETEED